MLIGIGIDLVSVSRIEREISLDPDWSKDVFTPFEIEYCENKHYPPQHYAARFASKEAFFKALPDSPPRGLIWRDIEIYRLPDGKPQISLSGHIAAFVSRLRVRSIFLSISHTRDLAIANVAIDADPEQDNSLNNKDVE